MTTASAIADALEAHFVHPDDPTSGVTLREVMAPGSQRRIDLLAVGLWASRGYGIDAVEIKVDRADYQREISSPAKAEPWWRCSNRFWIAAPSTQIADPNVLPPGWGLLVPGNGRRFKVVVKPEERPLEVGMPLFAAILGRQVNATQQRHLNALRQQRDDLAAKHRDELKRVRDDLAAGADPEVRQALNQIRLVQAAAGLELHSWSWGDNVTPEEFGRAIRVVIEEQRAQRDASTLVAEVVDQIRSRAKRLSAAADELSKIAGAAARPEAAGGAR